MGKEATGESKVGTVGTTPVAPLARLLSRSVRKVQLETSLGSTF